MKTGMVGVLSRVVLVLVFLAAGTVVVALLAGVGFVPSVEQESTATVTPTPMPDVQPGTPEVEGIPDVDSVESAIHQAVNAYRDEHGLLTLGFDERLADIARDHSHDMHERGFFDHNNPDSDGPGERVGDHCVSVGENLAINYWDRTLTDGTHHTSVESLAADVVRQWIDSPGHRENLERQEFTRQGIGVYIDEDTNRVYVTQNLCPPA